MPEKVRWGVLGAAKIARTKVIPAMQKGALCEITAIASRDLTTAQAAAKDLGIPKAYGSYDELLADPDIDAIYNPLPNHLHVPWSIRAAEAGKHVLCEKPVALNAAECRTLIAARDRTGVLIGEAFMVRSHPQWLRTRELVQLGELGEIQSILAVFSYFNRDPKNIRSNANFGGGALMDIGCYPIQVSRFVLGQEPGRVAALIDRDPEMQIDRLTSALIQFESAHLAFTCGTQMAPAQWVQIFGTTGRVEIEIPFNAPPDRPTRILVTRGVDRAGGVTETEEFPVCDQYTLQGDAFSQAIRNKTAPPTPLEDSLRNMLVIDAVFEAGRAHQWVNL